MNMRRILSLIFSSCVILSCASHRQVHSDLKQADAIMFQHPDSALAILQGISPNELITQEERAYHALLLSQALDRNGIIVKNDSIITPALDYYRNHGSQDLKLRNCYYAATIADNAGDTEAAMEWLARGEAHIPQANDLYHAGHIYLMKSRLYKDQYDYSAALDNDLKSSSYFKENQYLPKYALSQISLADDYLHMDNLAAAGEALDVLVPYWNDLSINVKADYFETRIDVAAAANDTLYVTALKDSCFSQISNRALRPWLAISYAYSSSGMLDSALYVLGEYSRYFPESLDNDYYTRLAEVYEKQGDYTSSVAMLKKANEADKKFIKEVMNSDTRFMEERYRTQLEQLRQKHLITTLIAVFSGLLLIGWISISFFRRAWKKTQFSLNSLSSQYETLQKERDALWEAHQKSDMMNEETRKVVTERLALLDKVLLGHITSNPADSKAANEGIGKLLQNKDEFINSTAISFAASHPKFVDFLKQHNLTQWEIGYCCLFLMGMYSKDIEPHFSKAASNTYNSTIRNKLGLSLNGQKLKTYLLETCKNLESES